ncbi:hypothetical protein HDV05_000688 [Chytridiales sp. JEL 0842]|nr:hypothetical protein HDV05_000688 [Chytridiales sp. JEL 0842]
MIAEHQRQLREKYSRDISGTSKLKASNQSPDNESKEMIQSATQKSSEMEAELTQNVLLKSMLNEEKSVLRYFGNLRGKTTCAKVAPSNTILVASSTNAQENNDGNGTVVVNVTQTAPTSENVMKFEDVKPAGMNDLLVNKEGEAAGSQTVLAERPSLILNSAKQSEVGAHLQLQLTIQADLTRSQTSIEQREEQIHELSNQLKLLTSFIFGLFYVVSAETKLGDMPMVYKPYDTANERADSEANSRTGHKCR